MNNEFETMKTELNKKIEIFKKEADKYDGRLVYTITAVRVTYNHDQEYVRVSEPRNAQKRFGDFSSALEAFLALSQKFANSNDNWVGFAFNFDRGCLPILSGSLFYCSLDELEEKTADKFSNLGKTESGSFGVCDFCAQSPSGESCQINLFVSDADKAEKASEDDGVSYAEIIESFMEYNDYSKETIESYYDFCEKAEKVEKALTEKGTYKLCFVKNAVNVSAVTEEYENEDEEAEGEDCEEVVFSSIVPFTFEPPYFTSLRAAIKNMLNDILASIGPIEPDPTRLQFFGTIETSEEKINAVLEEVRKGKSVPILGFIRGDGTSELELFRSMSVCLIEE